jgi:hypothetical protein
MHVKSITWNQLYTLIGTHRNKPHPKPRPEPPPASLTASHGSAADSPNAHVEQSVIKIKTSRDDFGFLGPADSPPLKVEQSVASEQTVRVFTSDGQQLLFMPRMSSCIIHIKMYIAHKSVK